MATIPEGVRVKTIAQKDGYEYVCCDYAAGWAKPMQTAPTQEEVFTSNQLKRKEYYLIDDETMLMSLPTYSAECESEELLICTVGTYFEVSKIVSTGKRKWGFTQIDGKKGFINLACAEETTSPLVIGVSALLTIAALVFAVLGLKKILKKRKATA